MYFEVYADSLFLLEFVMNLYLLSLVNGMLKQKVRSRRIFVGALGGAFLSLLPFLLPFKLYFSIFLSFFVSAICMTVITFRAYGREQFRRVLEKLAISMVLLGGLLMFLLRFLFKGGDACPGICSVLLLGGVSYKLLQGLVRRNSKEKSVYRVTLFGEKSLCVEALVDTGNSLVEPISGKPVAVLDKEVFEKVFPQKPKVFRLIPYHSIGKKSGVLPGYQLERIVVETRENTKEYREVYIGVSEEILSEVNTYKMILNPRLLE